MTLMEARCAVWAASNLCRGKDPPVDLEKVNIDFSGCGVIIILNV